MKEKNFKAKRQRKHLKKIIAFLSAMAIVGTVSGVGSYSVYSDDGLTEEPLTEEPLAEKTLEETTPIGQENLEDSPSFESSVDVNGVMVSVTAEEGVFPENSWLSVDRVENDEKEKIDSAIDELRDKNANKAVSYTYDIKVLDKDGVEIQPADGKEVRVSFATDEVANKNLDTNIYHVEGDKKLDVTALDVKTDGNVAEAVTDGFSYYTVEFTYEDKQYVLEGDDCVRLSNLLEGVGLTGEVSSYEISNTALFNIFLGDEEGIDYDYEYIDEMEYETPKNKEGGTIPYMVALKAFTTEEWLDVVIDGVTYHIIVTDAIVNGGATTINDDRVIQGGNEDNFTADMPLATIWINEDYINKGSENLLPPTLRTPAQYAAYMSQHGEAPSWQVGDIDYDNPANTGKLVARIVYNGTRTGMKVDDTSNDKNYGQLYFDFSEGSLSYGSGMTDNYWEGAVAEYRIINGAERYNAQTMQYEKYDVVITYSNIHLSLQNNLTSDNYGKLTKLNLLDTNHVAPRLFATATLGTSANDRTGLKMDVNIKVVDKDNKLINGSYYFPIVDMDINRYGNSGFAKLYDATTNENNYYSEQLVLLSNYGRPTAAGDEWEQKIWIPGGDYDPSKLPRQDTNMPYVSSIDNVGGNLRIRPSYRVEGNKIKDFGYGQIDKGSYTESRNEDFYTGFATLANNTKGGIKFRFWGTSAYNASVGGSGTVDSYLLAGTRTINHKLDASSDEGGTIYTTTTGNADGTLSGGALVGNNLVNTPHEISAATGQSVTYTMTPKGGYKIKNVYVKKGDIHVFDEVSGDNGDGFKVTTNTDDNLKAKDHGIYTYTFKNINEDNSIHVEWEKTQTTVTKNIDPAEQGVTQPFTFKIRLWDTSTQETTWRVRAKKNNFVFRQDNSIAEETPYYMSYYESHNEMGDIETYTPVDPSDYTDSTNPYESGWYEEETSGGVTRYYLTNDTEVTDDTKIYYIKQTTQGNIPRYFHHILGYNAETERWEDRVEKSDSAHETAADLGTDNLDNELGDNYRFTQKDGKVYVKSSYDVENEVYTEYLMWITDEDDESNEILVVGNATKYPEGRAFVPGESDNNYIYVWDNVDGYSGKVIQIDVDYSLNGQIHAPNGSENKYKCEKDENSAVYYDFATNPDDYQIGSGYSKLEGESGMYVITLPAGQSPDLSGFDGTDWEPYLSPVSKTPDTFDMDAAFADKGATKISGETNTYSFTIGANETIDFEGCVPMGWNYEIIESPADGWELKDSSNAAVSNYDGDEAVSFTNRRIFDLAVEKKVTGNMGSKEKYFKFDIILTAPAGTVLNLDAGDLSKFDGGGSEKPSEDTIYTKGEINAANSRDDDNNPDNGQQIIIPLTENVTFSIYMKHDQKFIISKLLMGSSYSISEVNEGYMLSADLSGGADENKNDSITSAGEEITLSGTTIADNYLKGDADILFINNMDVIVPTGVGHFPWYWVVVTGALAGGVVVYVVKRKKDKKEAG